LALALASGLGSACTTRERPAPPAREAPSAAEAKKDAPPATAEAASPAAPAAPLAPPNGPTLLPTAAASDSPPPIGPKLIPGTSRKAGDVLATFYAALRELSSGARKKHVRVLWLGDSHGAADFWSGNVRAALQKRFGNGGPGFVHVGHRDYRHDGLKVTADGKWKRRPSNPATRIATGDGVFGLGGIMVLGAAGLPPPSISITDPAIPSSLTWDLCYRMTTPKDELKISVTGAQDVGVKAPAELVLPSKAVGPTSASYAPLSHATIVSEGAGPTFSVAIPSGMPELCGVVVEAPPEKQAGVVLDTLGINGARLATPLAWNEAAWAAELARRMPELVILEYGTNEMSDRIRPAMFTEQLRAVMTRIRKVRPDVDCVALAPTDRADTEDRVLVARDAMREAAMENGCAFWDTVTIMGGVGSIRAWAREDPPRAAKDGVHLSWRGYRELGTKLAEDILRGYTP
jgi:lysophospholipase L1-like esterase